MAQLEREREALPGEKCSCGRAAELVFLTDRFGEVPWCGVSEPDEAPSVQERSPVAGELLAER